MMDDFPWRGQYEDGVPDGIEYPDIAIDQFLTAAAAQHPERTCTLFRGARMSYQELQDESSRLAGALAELGLEPRAIVGICMPASPQFITAFFGVLKLGACAVVIDPHQPIAEIAGQAAGAGIQVILVMSNLYNEIKAVQSRTRIRTVIVSNIKEALPPVSAFLFTILREKKDGYRVELQPGDHRIQDLTEAREPGERPIVEISGDDRALYMYRQDGEGNFRAIIALHRNLAANALQLQSWLPGLEHADEVFLLSTPLYRFHGLVTGLLLGIASAATLVLAPHPGKPDDLVRHIKRHRVTIFPCNPEWVGAIAGQAKLESQAGDFESLKCSLAAPAPLKPRFREAFESHTGSRVVELYGPPEALAATHAAPQHGDSPPGSIGLPLPDVEVRIVSRRDGVTVLPPGEIGEIVVRGPQVMFGYHKLPLVTRNTIRDGWLYTGADGYMNEDGYFFPIPNNQ